MSTALCLQWATLGYSRDVSIWEEVQVPAKKDRGEGAVWRSAAKHSEREWCVYLLDGRVEARLEHEPDPFPRERPDFSIKTEQWDVPRDKKLHSACAQVADGWLVGFNRGEFGAELRWFSADGSRSAKVSDHQVVDFFRLDDCLYAIEGLAHMSTNRGSVIRLEQPRTGAPWEVKCIKTLPSMPHAVAVLADGSAALVLSDMILQLDPGLELRILLRDAPFRGLHISTAVATPDGNRLYLGMRQFVGEVELATGVLRLLIPSRIFLDVLPEDEAARIGEQHAR